MTGRFAVIFDHGQPNIFPACNLLWLVFRTSPSNWRDAKVIGNYVYIVSEAANHGMQVSLVLCLAHCQDEE